jgi:putative salt-induced outer membrane protein
MEMQNKSHEACAWRPFVAGLCLGSLLIGAATGYAEPTNRWESVAAVGVTLTRGNSETFLATASINTARKWLKEEALLGLAGGYGETTDVQTDNTTKTQQYLRGFGQGNHLFTPRFYAGLRLDGLYDDIAGINYRFTVSPLVGYYIVKKPDVFLALESGPSFIAEQLEDEAPRQYWAARVGDRFEYKFPGNRARIWQTASLVPEFDNLNNWVLTFQAGIASSITKSLELRLVADDQYDNEPAPHRKNNDFKLTAQLGYKF